ncbi:VWA domain-containing protein [Hassallia byssoidea VB512170]|uniref:VWA domain-containing protein n=1 Tax=Hassallia byssoidea VB512170 TaxID=1304833 RepID=A0A846HE44_9CYAN|nr:VWA domain-containing protein [Hassalia byssoidea VB512170]
MIFTQVIPGQPLSSVQKIGLNLVSVFPGKRDVVLAIDLTESVGLNDEGRIRLRQIVEDSLKPGDSVYVVPFDKNVALEEVTPGVNPLGTPIQFSSKSQENIDKVLAKIPFAFDPNRYGTDIQRAELSIYQGLAQINQNRLYKSQRIKPQSVVWVTDAPLFTQPGITSQVWVETPALSPFRIANSPESQQRQSWIKALPIKERSRSITTNNNKEYKLTVVDIAPTVQEICTPAPGGEETCLVTSYLIKQLWLPSLISLLIFAGLVFGLIKFLRLQKKWELKVDFEATENPEDQKCRLPNNKRIAIGEYDASCTDSIDCPGSEVRAYLERKGEKLYLVPTNLAPIYYNNKEITSRTFISSSTFRINCPYKNRDYQIVIKVKK